MKYLTMAAMIGATSASDDCYNVFTKVTKYVDKDCKEAKSGQDDTALQVNAEIVNTIFFPTQSGKNIDCF